MFEKRGGCAAFGNDVLPACGSRARAGRTIAQGYAILNFALFGLDLCAVLW